MAEQTVCYSDTVYWSVNQVSTVISVEPKMYTQWVFQN